MSPGKKFAVVLERLDGWGGPTADHLSREPAGGLVQSRFDLQQVIRMLVEQLHEQVDRLFGPAGVDRLVAPAEQFAGGDVEIDVDLGEFSAAGDRQQGEEQGEQEGS